MPEKKLYADRKSPQKVKIIIGQINTCTNTNSKLEEPIHVLHMHVQRILKYRQILSTILQ